MPELRVTPLAFESLGVRSMATHVETDDLSMVIDPAVALAPNRFGLPPHAIEERARSELWGVVRERAEAADVLVVSHYHYDHVEPKEPELFAGKRVFVKHPRRMINPSQRERAASFLRSIKDLAEEIIYADDRSYRLGGTEVRFSKPVPHGSDATRGYVVEICIEAGESFLYTSDVQGPVLDEQMDFIMSEGPETIFVDGPSTYFDSPHTPFEVRKANENLMKILEGGAVRRLVVDHHLTRDREYRDHIMPLLDAGKELGVTVQVAAEFLDLEPNLLEARREELHSRIG